MGNLGPAGEGGVSATPPTLPPGPEQRAAEAALDATWIARAQAGDGTAFDALVRTYAPLVHRVIGRLGADPDDCADLVQETFLKAWQGLARFTPEAPFRPWLLTIAINCGRDAGRRRRRRPRTEPFAEDRESATPDRVLRAPDPTPDAHAEGEDLRERAERAFDRLSPDARAVLWLRVREDLSYDEIAVVLGVPRGTVMSRLARAREALRIHLAEDGE